MKYKEQIILIIYIAITGLLLSQPTFVKAQITSGDINYSPYIDNIGKADYCYNNERVLNLTDNATQICYTVKPGDTLWNIAEIYYKNGFDWKKIKILSSDYKESIIEYPEKLEVGTKLVIYNAKELNPYKNYDFVDTIGIDNKSHQLYTLSRTYNGEGVINIGKQLYDGPYHSLGKFLVDLKTNNKLYIADTEKRGCAHVIFNKNINPLYSCGWDYKLLTFSADGKHYAIRNNKAQGQNKFIVLSDIGNGSFYDYSDSLIWYDNETLIYRAQNNDVWRLVINNEDYAIYNYLENLHIENMVIKFDARHDDGTWSKETVNLK